MKCSGRIFGMALLLAVVLGGCATTPAPEDTTTWLVEAVVEVSPGDAVRIRNQHGPILARLSAQAAAQDMVIAYQYGGHTLVRIHPDGRYILGRGATDPVYVREPATVTLPAPWDTVGTFSIVGYDPRPGRSASPSSRGCSGVGKASSGRGGVGWSPPQAVWM